MLAQLKGLFTPEAIAKTLAPMPPLESTIMDALFKNRPSHPLPVIGVQDLTPVVQTVPVVRRDGTPVNLDNEAVSMQFVAPLPVKVQIPVTASELNDLKVIFGNQAAVAAWRARKVDQVRRAVRDTTEGMCAVVATTGKLSAEEQFYMRSRGIPEDEARVLQMISFLSPVLEAVEEAAREDIASALEAAVRQIAAQ